MIKSEDIVNNKWIIEYIKQLFMKYGYRLYVDDEDEFIKELIETWIESGRDAVVDYIMIIIRKNRYGCS